MLFKALAILLGIINLTLVVSIATIPFTPAFSEQKNSPIQFSSISYADIDNKGIQITLDTAVVNNLSATVPYDTLHIPILMYHHIDTIPADQTNNPIAVGLRVSPTIFDRQMEKIANAGFTSLTMQEYWDIITGQKEKPVKPILLTFDDGYQDNYSQALPILLKHHLKGNFALISGVMGTSEYMSWDNARELVKNGMGIISHTTLHCALAVKKKVDGKITYLDNGPDQKVEACPGFTYAGTLSEGQVSYEVNQSKKDLEGQLKIPVQSFSYPYGNYNQTTLKLAQAAGYKIAFTTASSVPIESENPYLELPRIAISGQQDGDLRGFFAEIY